MNGKREKFTSTWKPKTQPSTHHAKRFYRKKFAPPQLADGDHPRPSKPSIHFLGSPVDFHDLFRPHPKSEHGIADVDPSSGTKARGRGF
jgi:hypothetical protein